MPINPFWLALFYGLSETAISTLLRSKSESSATDKGSLALIWRVIGASMIAAMFAAVYMHFAHFDGGATLYWVGFAMFVGGIALRWYSISYLGRFFTVDVTVKSDQTVVDTGPYKFIRHPSYTGSLLAFLGLGICFANYATLAIMMIPITSVFLYRMKIEEAALQTGLGEAYRNYMSRTKRLVPFLY